MRLFPYSKGSSIVKSLLWVNRGEDELWIFLSRFGEATGGRAPGTQRDFSLDVG